MGNRDAYEYDEVTAAEILRSLDPVEHNMERLNRLGRGAGTVYQTARTRGPLRRAAFEAAVDALTRRHPALRLRVVRGSDGALCFAEHPTCRPEIVWIEVDDPASAWPRRVEADMNAGPVPSHRGPSFRFFVLGNDDEHAITIAAPHHLMDGVCSVALMRELLDHVAHPRVLPPLRLRAAESPFAATWRGEEVAPRHPDARYVVAEDDAGPSPERARRVSTGLVVRVIAADMMKRLTAEARRRGVSMHGVFGSALALAHAGRQWALTSIPDRPEVFPIASPVNLRRQFHPPLADTDVRMAVEPAFTFLSVGPADAFWEVALRFAASVSSDVQTHRVLGAWFRTERQSTEHPLPGAPIPLLSNVGKVAIESRYGDLELLELHCAMATHSMFQIAMLVQTLDDVANVAYYHELPTVSRASMLRFVEAVHALLRRVATGASPTARDAVELSRP